MYLSRKNSQSATQTEAMTIFSKQTISDISEKLLRNILSQAS